MVFDEKKYKTTYNKKHYERVRNNPEYREQQRIRGQAYRQTDRGIFIRNKSHWIDSGIREPAETWDIYWETFKTKTHCEVCNIKFNLENANSSEGRCLDHHHHSGYIRNVICRSCNRSVMRNFDNKHNMVLFELQRYFRTNLDLIKIETNRI